MAQVIVLGAGIGGLPAGFKGVTRFKYRVTDSSSATAIGTAAVFVGVEPFRVVFAGDPAASLAQCEAGITRADDAQLRWRAARAKVE